MDIEKKLIDIIGPYKVYEVDGEEIRADIEPNFTNFASHLNFDFVPENEFWVDRENDPGETMFFITRMEMKKKLVDHGMDKDKAEEIAERAELADRAKSKKFQKLSKGREVPDKLKLKKIFDFGGVNGYLVDGEMVRDFYYEDFTEGGHGYVYNWIPKDEVWIDDDVSEEERPDVILHEVYEREKMINGESYEEAHKAALELELIVKSQRVNGEK